MTLQTLTPAEEDVMRAIWQQEKIYFRELMASLPEPKPHQNTVSTFLKILVEKDYLTTEKVGRKFLYTPTVSLQDYKKFMLRRFLENYFSNSAGDLIQMLEEENLIEKGENAQPKNRTIISENNLKPKENPIQELIRELTTDKKSKKPKKKKDKKK